jgi:hypothetical protein
LLQTGEKYLQETNIIVYQNAIRKHDSTARDKGQS